jgi:hypothetical protein
VPDENANADPLPLYWDSPQHAGAAPPPRGEGGGGGSVSHFLFNILEIFVCIWIFVIQWVLPPRFAPAIDDV